VDQIHTYAATRHREFVISHVETWIDRAELLSSSDDELSSSDDESESSVRSVNLDELALSIRRHKPEWLLVKEDAQAAKMALRRETWKRKRPETDDPAEGSSAAQLRSKKRGKAVVRD
jgi:hypothetical protein